MSDPGYALQVAMADRLLTDPAVVALVGGGVYAQVPAAAPYPYVTIGDDQIIGLDEPCKTASEVISQVHIWAADAQRTLTARSIAAAVRACLTAEFPLAGFEIVLGEYRDALHLDDPGGGLTHSVLSFRYLIDPIP